MRATSIRLAALAAALATPAAAFWRLPCAAPIVTERADPIMDPGAVSGHVHTVMGGDGFGFEMTYNDTQASTCSSCAVTKDFSNYWVPTLYYKAQNGSFVDVKQGGGSLIYYLQREDEKDPEYSSGLLAFPEGFRMVAGDPLRRSFNASSIPDQAISYTCLGTSTTETNGFPNITCPDGLRAQVFFPSCWDGVNLDSPDHKSHMAYPSMYNNGFCPSSHPKRFISIFYEVIWNTQGFEWYSDTQPFMMSNGDPTGYGYHGDFVNGWDVPTLQKAVTECTAASGVVEDCPVFEFFDDDVTNGCKVPASINEQITGVLDALPGCNPLQAGPEDAVSKSGCGATTTVGKAELVFTDLAASHGFEYLGCGYDPAGESRTLNGSSLTANNMTNAICVEFCKDAGFTIAGTEYSTQCYCSDEMAADRAPKAGLVGNCEMPCSGNSTEMCGGAATISLYKKCGGGECSNAQYGINNGTVAASTAAANITTRAARRSSMRSGLKHAHFHKM